MRLRQYDRLRVFYYTCDSVVPWCLAPGLEPQFGSIRELSDWWIDTTWREGVWQALYVVHQPLVKAICHDILDLVSPTLPAKEEVIAPGNRVSRSRSSSIQDKNKEISLAELVHSTAYLTARQVSTFKYWPQNLFYVYGFSDIHVPVLLGDKKLIGLLVWGLFERIVEVI